MALQLQPFQLNEKIEGIYNENKRIFESLKQIKIYERNNTFFELADSNTRLTGSSTLKEGHVAAFKIQSTGLRKHNIGFDFDSHPCFPPFVHTRTFFCGKECHPILRLSTLEKSNHEIYEQTKKTKTHIKEDLQEEVLGQLYTNLVEINVYIGKTYGNLIDTNESKKKQAEPIISRIQKDFDELAFLTDFLSFEIMPTRSPVVIRARGGIPDNSDEEEDDYEPKLYPPKTKRKPFDDE